MASLSIGPYRPSANRVCAATYTFESDLADGQTLLRCEGGCLETYYISREPQADHWRKIIASSVSELKLIFLN